MKARILEPTPDHIRQAASALRKGELVALPTETVYGLGGCLFLPYALAKIFDTKERPTFDPLIVHVDDSHRSVQSLIDAELIDAKKIKAPLRKKLEKLMQAFWPGPLTLVLPKNPKVPDLATSGLSSVGIRMPRHPVAQALLRATQIPIAAPSANRFGSISPTSAPDVDKELGDRIEWILDGGRCEVGVESTVLRVTESGGFQILRPGAISREMLEEVLRTKVTTVSKVQTGRNIKKGQISPGQLKSHYAPKKKLTLLKGPARKLKTLSFKKGSTLGFLLLSGNENTERARLALTLKIPSEKIIVRVLSPSADFQEMAHHLFSALRELDHSKAQLLFAEPCKQKTGIGYAIADRLGRAAAVKSQA